MADFRKWFLVLAVLAAFVIPANAQVQATCNLTTSPNIIRSEGLAETVGDVVMSCANASGAPVVTSITAIFSAPVTSLANEAKLLTNNDVATAVSGVTSGTFSVVFSNISIPTGTPEIRISRVRVNASQVAVGTQVTATVVVTPANVLFNKNDGNVAAVQTGLVFKEASGNDVNPGPLAFKQCITGSSSKQTVNLNFTEGFGAAFVVATPVAPVGTQSATRIFVRFTGIPSNVVIGVPETITSNATPTAGSATLVSFDPTTTTTLTSLPSLPSGSPLTAGLIPVTITSGSGAAVYEITAANDGVSETFTVPVTIAVTSGVAATLSTAPALAGGGFAPVTTDAKVAPRFVDVSSTNTATVLTVSACVTNLLFPFVTNQAGFDTGIALVNTSQDNSGDKTPFNTAAQSGACTVFFFNGTTTAPAPQTTGTIPAGGMVAFTLQGGGVAGSTSSAAGFQGYIIATCSFQYGHGFAFISDRNTPSLGSQGYLALVIPNTKKGDRPADPFPQAGAGTGEQLGQ